MSMAAQGLRRTGGNSCGEEATAPAGGAPDDSRLRPRQASTPAEGMHRNAVIDVTIQAARGRFGCLPFGRSCGA